METDWIDALVLLDVRKRKQILNDGLLEAISDLRFIRTATKDAHIAALAGSAALVAELYLKQAKGETK
jgi:hypothetical protein